MENLHKGVYLVLILCIISTSALEAQKAHKHRRTGDLFYDQGEYTVAEEEYRKANSADPAAETTYNLGNTIYQQERLEEAVVQFENAAEQATDSDLKSDAYFNLGNAYLEAQQFDKSVESYIKALQADPDDMDTKKNLTFALQQLKQQQQQQQQQQQNEQSKQNEEQEEEQEQQQQQQQQQEEQDEPQQQPQPQEQELSSDEAEELLRIIESEDQKVQGKLRKADKGKKKPKKDW